MKNVSALSSLISLLFLNAHVLTLLARVQKKSAKVQKEVARIQAQASMAGKSPDVLAKEREKELRAKAKAEEEQRKRDDAALLRPVQAQKVPFGVDPKTLLCAFFKAGHCDKGVKCKFSHNLDVERKVEKRNLYADTREEKLAGECVRLLLHGRLIPSRSKIRWIPGTRRSSERLCSRNTATHGQQPTCVSLNPSHLSHLTVSYYPCQIVCKNFIEAIETQKYILPREMARPIYSHL